jgi:hypothetical protein
MMRCILLAIAMLAALPAAARPLEAPPPAGELPLAGAGVETRVFSLEAGQGRVELGRSFIVPGSDSVLLDGEPLRRGDDYRINALRGTIVLVRPAAGGERLVVRFERYPFPFSPVFVSNVPESAGDEIPVAAPARAGAVPDRRRASEPYRLRLAGSKTIGVSVGSNRNLGLDQSLKVTMVGTVAKDLEVSAYLTDDDLPVQPAGNTEELKQLDRVYVQVKSKHSLVRLGDFSSELSWFRFSRWKRDLRGVSAEVGAAGQSFISGGGIARGRFRTARIAGREGVQGPYELLPAQRFNSVTILAGTEAVYCDGRPLRRGSENDYTIDYGRGTVSFTERLPVTNDSEIVVDYEVSEFGFDRSTLFAGWTSPTWGGAFSIRTALFQEGDDEESALAGALSAGDRAILAAAGDDPEKAIASGVALVEEGAGDYTAINAGSDSAYFAFVETGGEYRLEFIDVGAGNGDYLTDGFSAKGYVKYRWAGPGRGNFRIGRKLPLPERKRLFAVGASASKGAAYLDAEGTVSDYDRNLLSSLDGGDDAARALRLDGGLREYAVPSAKLSLTAGLSRVGASYAAPDRVREAYFYRDWGLEDEPLTLTETIAGGRVAIVGERAWNAAAGYQRLSRGADVSARKADFEGGIGDPDSRGVGVRVMSSSAGDDRERRFVRSAGAFSLWHVVPRVAFESERYAVRSSASPDTGRFYRQGTVSLATRDTGPWRGMLSLARRNTDVLDTLESAWRRGRENDEMSFDGAFSRGARIVELLATHRRSREPLDERASVGNLARLRARNTWERAGVAADVSYRLGGGEERTLQKSVIYVGAMQGDYDAAGREVGQKRGDYMLVYIPGAERVRVNTVELGMQASFGAGVRGIGGDGGKDGFWGTLKREISLDHFFSVIERSRTDDLTGLFLLRPALLQRDDATVYGVTRLREECTIFNSSRIFKLRVAYSREDEEDNRTEGSPAETFARELRLRAESAAWSAVALTWEARSALSRRETAVASAERYEIETVALSQTVVYRFGPSTKISLETGAERRSDAVSAARQVSYIATPSFSSSIGARFNAAAFVRVTYTNAETSAGKPLFFLEEGFREDWNAVGQYRVSQNISFGLNYTGRREKNYRGEVSTVHDLKMESRAYF